MFPKQPVTITLSHDDEYRVPAPSGRESSAYYTTDRADALNTCVVMWNVPVAPRIKRVHHHPQQR